jgi:hypothetical protein
MSDDGHVINESKTPTPELPRAIRKTWAGFAQLLEAAPPDGALPARVKELIAAAVKRCDSFIADHAKAAPQRSHPDCRLETA